jgi:hypothetical protein
MAANQELLKSLMAKYSDIAEFIQWFASKYGPQAWNTYLDTANWSDPNQQIQVIENTYNEWKSQKPQATTTTPQTTTAAPATPTASTVTYTQLIPNSLFMGSDGSYYGWDDNMGAPSKIPIDPLVAKSMYEAYQKQLVGDTGKTDELNWAELELKRQQVAEQSRQWWAEQQTREAANKTTTEQNALQLKLQRDAQAAELKKSPQDWIAASEFINGAPPRAPSWLPQFVENQTAGQTITPGRVTVPNAYQWNNTPWVQRQMLGGYLPWAAGAGGVPTAQDLAELIARSLPNPNAKQAKWQPAYQR